MRVLNGEGALSEASVLEPAEPCIVVIFAVGTAVNRIGICRCQSWHLVERIEGEPFRLLCPALADELIGVRRCRVKPGP